MGVASNAAEEDDGNDAHSPLSAHSDDGDDAAPRQTRHVTQGAPGAKFSDKVIEVYQSPWQPSATPAHLQHRFMVSEYK